MIESLGCRAGLSVSVDTMRYPDAERELIRELSLDVKLGECVALLGASGMGKTTLLRIIAGLERRFSGSVRVAGACKVAPARDVQLVFQESRLYPWMTARENVLFALADAGTSEARETADSLLAKVGLEGKETRWPRDLSGGEVARVALARAVAGESTVLLLDEPFANVDLGVKRELQSLVLELAAGREMCVLFVTHSIVDAVMVSDRIYVANSQPMGHLLSHTIELPRPRSALSEELRSVASAVERDLLAGENRTVATPGGGGGGVVGSIVSRR